MCTLIVEGEQVPRLFKAIGVERSEREEATSTLFKGEEKGYHGSPRGRLARVAPLSERERTWGTLLCKEEDCGYHDLKREEAGTMILWRRGGQGSRISDSW